MNTAARLSLASPLRWPRWASGQHGFALPAATIALLLLSTLVMAFAVVSTSEPTIAANHLRAAQARALAAAGVEHASWALTTIRVPDLSPGTVAPAPYDGRTFFPLGPVGGFEVTVAAGPVPTERAIQAVGYAPRPTPSVLDGSRRRLTLTLHRLRWLDPPAPVTTGSDLVITGAATIDSRSDASCGAKAGVSTTGTATAGGTVYGHGDDVDSGAAPDRITGASPSRLDDHGFTDTDVATIRSIARCCGVYLTGDQTFSDSNPLPGHGLVFIDTVDGTTLSCAGPGPGHGCEPASGGPVVKVLGNAAPTGASEFRGWLIVNGALVWTGGTRARGFLYAQDTAALSGGEALRGAVVSRNVSRLPSTIDGASLTWDCHAARTGGDSVPMAWLPKPGTFREVAD